MVDPLVLVGIDIELRAEWPFVEGVLRPLVHHGSLLAREWPLIVVSFYEVLAYFLTEAFKEIAKVCNYRVVAPQGLWLLQQVDDADDGQQAEYRSGPGPSGVGRDRDQRNHHPQHTNRESQVARRHHRISPAAGRGNRYRRPRSTVLPSASACFRGQNAGGRPSAGASARPDGLRGPLPSHWISPNCCIRRHASFRRCPRRFSAAPTLRCVQLRRDAIGRLLRA